NQLVVVVYNSLARPRTELVRIPVNNNRVTVTGPTGNVVTSQVLAIPFNPARVGDSAPYEVRFFAVNVPGIGLSTYFLTFSSSDSNSDSDGNEERMDVSEVESQNRKLLSKIRYHRKHQEEDAIAAVANPVQARSIQNEFWRVNFDQNGLVSSLDDLESGTNY